MSEKKGVHRILFRQASLSFDDVGPVKHMLEAMDTENPLEIPMLLKEFDTVCRDLKKIRKQPLDPNYYSHVIKLNEMLGDKPIMTLKEAVRDASSCPHTFIAIHDLTVNKEWMFPIDSSLSYSKKVTGFLIEGYGLDLSYRHHNPDLAGEFVLAFEEVMFTRHPGLNLLADALEWMIDPEERKDFSPEVRVDLELLSHLPTTINDQVERLPQTDEERFKLTQDLFKELGKLFSEKGVPIVKREFRLKDYWDLRIKGASIWRGKKIHTPLGDIFAARFVLPKEAIPAAVEAIKSHWRTPPVLRNGTATDREFSETEKRNRFSDASYTGRHINIIFQDANGRSQIAEVQLLTPEQAEIAISTRKNYLRNRRRR